jgi:hypothetical protein
MERTLPPAFLELQKACSIDPEELNELLRFIDEFERLREEDLYTQGHSYLWTREGSDQLWQRLYASMLKATYIPRNTQELLRLPSQLGMTFCLRVAYDPAYQICACIKFQQERYFPQEPSRSVVEKDLCFILSGIAELLYLQQRSHLSIDEMKESHIPHLVMRSKRTLAKCIALFLEKGFLQGTAPGNRFSLQVDYELAPLFTVLRTLQRQMRAETDSVSGRRCL